MIINLDYIYIANATQAILNLVLLTFKISAPQLSSVAPVVIMSSTNKICFPCKQTNRELVIEYVAARITAAATATANTKRSIAAPGSGDATSHIKTEQKCFSAEI